MRILPEALDDATPADIAGQIGDWGIGPLQPDRGRLLGGPFRGKARKPRAEGGRLAEG
jgi:hypothetical protein